MSRFLPRVGARAFALVVVTLVVTMFLPAQVAQAAAATHLRLLDVASNVTANRDIDSVTVQALDGGNNIDTTYAGTVTFSANHCTNPNPCFTVSTNSDMSNPLAGNAYSFQPFAVNQQPDQGTKTLYVQWNEGAVGSDQTLHVDGSNVTGTDAANTTHVLSNNPTKLTMTGPQTNATTNVSENITVAMTNEQNQSDPNLYTGTVTFSATCNSCFTISPNDGAGHETEYTYKNIDNSSKVFSLVWTTAGSGRTFTATGTGLTTTPQVSKTGISVTQGATTTTTPSTTTSSTTSTTLVPRQKAAMVVTGAAQGGGPHVIARLASDTSQIVYSFMAYDPAFTGGVRVATGDVNGDGWDDIITAAGPGGGPEVRVFSGKDLSLLGQLYAYAPTFTGGVFVAAGDVNGDGHADIITGADAGGGPHVRVFDGTKLGNADINTAQLLGFFAYDPAFTGGVRVASADFNNDGRADVVTAPGAGGGPHIRVWSGLDASELGGGHGFMAYDPAFTGGVYVAAINAQTPFIVTGAGAGGGRHVRVLDIHGAPNLEFMADPTSTEGAVPAVGRAGTPTNSLFYVARAQNNPAVQRFSNSDGQQISAFPAYQAGVGVFLAVGFF